MNSSAWTVRYRDERRSIVAANRGFPAISVISLLPAAPEGVWSDVSSTLASLASPTEFLSNLFCELASGGHLEIGETRLTLDGFLGSAFSHQDPWLLIPAISLWIPALGAVADVAEDLLGIVRRWEDLLAMPIELPSSRVPPASELGAFLPHARVPRKHIADAFEGAVRLRLSARSRSVRHS
jgi:hypothetical protein